MRRKDREITDKRDIEEVLSKAEVLRLAMTDGVEPYIVAMNFAYSDGALYMHSAREGRKIDVLRSNGRVAFQADIDVRLSISDEAGACTTKYRSVFGTGQATVTDDAQEKTAALDFIMEKYTGKSGWEYPDRVTGRMLVIQVDIDAMTGKQSD